jgi:hypothetical protein
MLNSVSTVPRATTFLDICGWKVLQWHGRSVATSTSSKLHRICTKLTRSTKMVFPETNEYCTWNIKVQQIQDTTGLFVAHGQAFKKKCPQDRRIGTNWTKDRIDHYVCVWMFHHSTFTNFPITRYCRNMSPPCDFTTRVPRVPPVCTILGRYIHQSSLSAIVMFANM